MHKQTLCLFATKVMIDWKLVYQKLMFDFKGERLIPHLAILGGGVAIGILVGLYFGGNLNLIFLIWIAAFLIDYLVFGSEIFEIFTKNKPYVLTGVITKKTKKIVIEKKNEIDEFWFDMEVREAYSLMRNGKSERHYYEREGLQGIQVPESMFLSLQIGQEVSLVCEPDDFAWGFVSGQEVIKIEA